MHCVILDNGRETMRADPMFSDALTCIRCGACSNACPPFMAVSGHQFGHIYNGPIGLVLTPFHHGLEASDLPNTLCTQCNACQEICPVDIPLPRQILEHRKKGRKSLRKKAVLGLWKRPELADRILRVGAPFSGLVPGAPRLARVPYRDQATVSEVDASGHETFVQNGWLRASERKLSTSTNNIFKSRSSVLEPIPTFLASDVRPMPAGQFAEVTIPLYYEGHAYRSGSRIRPDIRSI